MPAASTLKKTAAVAAGSLVAGIGYASIIERNAFVTREITMPVLTPGSTPLRVLHISDIHMRPNQKRKQAWLRELAGLQPDLVVNTGDNLAHPKAVPAVVITLFSLSMNASTDSCEPLSWLTATTPSAPSSLWLSAKAFKVGSSLMQGAHQLAHKLTSTGPRISAMLASSPSGAMNFAVGAASPLWLRSTPLCGPTSVAGGVSPVGCCVGLLQAARASVAMPMTMKRMAGR